MSTVMQRVLLSLSISILNKIKLLIIPIVLMLAVASCQKEENDSDLNITFIDTGVIKPYQEEPAVHVSPNPFNSRVQITMRGNQDREIIIADGKGRVKKITPSSDIVFVEFNEKKAEVYYCEVRIGNFIFREHLMKEVE